jgi:RTX calcium-binding nonapeptide repeat (4 copies)
MSARSMRRANRRQAGPERKRARPIGRTTAALVGAGTGAAMLSAPPAHADTLTVTSLDGGNDPGTLRAEIADANGNGEDDVIVFQAGLSGTIDLDVADVEILNDGLQIQGPGADQITVDANQNGRVFDLYGFGDANEQVSISGLTLTGGDTVGNGGGIESDGTGGNAAELTIADAVISGNDAGVGVGGGVYVDEGSLTITASVISSNHNRYSGGGVSVFDTDGDQTTEVTITDTVFSQNSSDYDGGGLYLGSNDGAALVARSTFIDNSVGYRGAGIYVNSSIDAPVTIESSTVSGNLAGSDGAGIYIRDPDEPILIQNTTVSGNSAEGAAGGVYINPDPDEDDDIALRNSTIAANTAADAGGGVYRARYVAGGGQYGSDSPTFSSTIIADNSAPVGPDLAEDPMIDTGDGSFVLGFSLVEAPGGATTTEDPAGSNLLGIDAQLGPLASNGGPTQTHAPALTSPVLDRGIANGLTTDQRGLARTSDLGLVPNGAGSDGTDIGSVEIQAAEVEAQCQATTVRRLAGGGGDDTLTGTDAPEALFGLAGNDSASGAGGNDCVSGDEGADNTTGGPGKDLVKGGAGKDKGSGGGGKDKVKGNAGRDNLKGGGGKDKLAGAGGGDRLSGGGGADKLKGGPGKDRLTGGGGKDRFNCGGGKDKVTVSPKDQVSRNCERVIEVS